ncbi:MAG: TetR/AcrR family transcriptional regulator [Clostridium sp.]|nr:TetR/AcrR family transcriptional regulator [Clostridium sp.]
MPPKAKITKEMILNSAFSILQKEGADRITARNISEHLNCSTQPVLYYFATVEDIKKAVYKKADDYHSNYIMNMEKDYGNPMLAIGMNYITFAIKEKNLFRFLFQTNEFSGNSMPDLLNQEELAPLLSVFQQTLNVSSEETKELFSTLFIFVHGYASLFANNSMVYDETQLINALTNVFNSTVSSLKGGKHEKN